MEVRLHGSQAGWSDFWCWSARGSQVRRSANYETAYTVYPFGVGADKDGLISLPASANNRRYSLHSQVLPYIERAALFNQINFYNTPFFPDTTGDPTAASSQGPNETAARTSLAVFLWT